MQVSLPLSFQPQPKQVVEEKEMSPLRVHSLASPLERRSSSDTHAWSTRTKLTVVINGAPQQGPTSFAFFEMGEKWGAGGWGAVRSETTSKS